VIGGSFVGNSATGDGGAIASIGTAASAVNVSITGALFEGNRADNGGTVDTNGDGTVLIKSVPMLGNQATGFGGGMSLRSSASVVIQSSLLQHNVVVRVFEPRLHFLEHAVAARRVGRHHHVVRRDHLGERPASRTMCSMSWSGSPSSASRYSRAILYFACWRSFGSVISGNSFF
jgi:predicted outer membrane repeat protein